MTPSRPILITGGAGFIGTHLCRGLLAKGFSVRVLDLVDPRDRVSGVEYRRGDILDPQALESAVQDVQAVYHLAAIVSVPLCQERVVDSYRTNVLGTTAVLEAVHHESMRTQSKVRVLFASSSAVYGDSGRLGVPISETIALPEPLSFYAAQKLASEQAIGLFHRTRGIPSVVFRFFNVFGVGQDPQSPYSGVISIFSEALKNGKRLKLNGGGPQTRDFVSVADVVQACVQALSLSESQCDGKPINIGSGLAISIRELAELLQRLLKRQTGTEDVAPREGDVAHSLADRTRAQALLGWVPSHNLAQGLEQVLRS